MGAPATDLDGNPRPCGDAVDIGVYEHQTGDCAGSATRFRRGDADADGRRNIADAVLVLGFLFLGGREPGCPDAADADDGGTINLADAVYLLEWLFRGGAAPAPPFPGCGADPTVDDLGCGTPPPDCEGPRRR